MIAPAVSVSIVNAGNSELLYDCLASLGGEDVEVVVLDNATGDGSVDEVRARFPDVRVIEQPFRAGFGANHNTVIRQTTSRYVYLLNDDTSADDWSFDRIVAYMDEHPEIGVLGPRLLYGDGRHQQSAWRFPSPGWSVVSALTLGKVGIEQSRGSAPRSVDWVTGAALLLRRGAIDEVGLFDEGFFMYSEETDLCRRIRRAGYDVCWFPQATVVHHVAQTSAAVPERRINELWRSRHRYWSKHHSTAGARMAALATGAQYALRGLLAPLAGRDDAFRARMRLHARDSRRVDGPGLRELAEEWNGRLGAPAH